MASGTTTALVRTLDDPEKRARRDVEQRPDATEAFGPDGGGLRRTAISPFLDLRYRAARRKVKVDEIIAAVCDDVAGTVRPSVGTSETAFGHGGRKGV